VRNVPGGGAVFTVWLPFSQPGVALRPLAEDGVARPIETVLRDRRAFVEEAEQWLAGDEAPAGIADAGAPVVLVVDDNADMRRYLRRLLGGRYEVRTAADGAAALRALAECPADLVLADVMMPDQDGLRLLRHIRDDPELRATPVIVLTALAGTEPTVRALAAGAHDYVVKPFIARELIARIESQLALARLRSTDRA
jgi:CheY-like chemotaxis protein